MLFERLVNCYHILNYYIFLKFEKSFFFGAAAANFEVCDNSSTPRSAAQSTQSVIPPEDQYRKRNNFSEVTIVFNKFLFEMVIGG